jgi:hypothetical protein
LSPALKTLSVSRAAASLCYTVTPSRRLVIFSHVSHY